jgi:putative tricarboxylic transport membrane protein
MIDNILLGINSFVSVANFVGIFLGVFSGIVIGVLPGLGAAMAMAIFVPLTYGQPAILSICFLLGIYKGAVYGGSVSAILINTPGTPAAAATILDGYPLAKMGKGGKALKMALYSSVIADISSDIMLILFSIPLALMALKFGPPEFFSLMIFSLTIIAGVSGDSLWKGLLCTNLGIFLSTVGTDTFTGSLRFTFGWIDIMGGLPLIPILIGLFAVSEIMIQFEGEKSDLVNRTKAFDLGINVLTWSEFKECIPAIVRSTFIGTGYRSDTGYRRNRFSICFLWCE